MRSTPKEATQRKTVSGQWVSTGASGYFTPADLNATMVKTGVGAHTLTLHDLKIIDSIVTNVSGGLQGYSVVSLGGANAVSVWVYRFTGEAQDWHFTFVAEGVAK